MKNCVLLLFCLILALFLVLQGPLLGALFLGFLLFSGYALLQGHPLRRVLAMAWSSIWKVRLLFIVFMLIGMLTGAWRASGTIAYLVLLFSEMIRPSCFLLLAFLANCAVSFLLGSSFATAATMGVVSMNIGLSLGVPPLFTGGAILSGVYFGDRMSPVSTSAMLVCVLTGTDIYRNIRSMACSAFAPFLLACAAYLLLGLRESAGAGAPAADSLRGFAALYSFSPWLLLPALSILGCSLLHVPIRWNMALSIALAALLALFEQGMPARELARSLILGYRSPSPELSGLADGGGLVSMLKVAAIVCLSSSYAGIFEATGLLDGLKAKFESLAARRGRAPAVAAAGLFSSLIACNQTFAIVLTHQICSRFGLSREKLALALEDSAVILSPLVPWSIACAVVLDATDSAAGAVFFAVYLYLIPLWNLWRSRGL